MCIISRWISVCWSVTRFVLHTALISLGGANSEQRPLMMVLYKANCIVAWVLCTVNQKYKFYSKTREITFWIGNGTDDFQLFLKLLLKRYDALVSTVSKNSIFIYETFEHIFDWSLFHTEANILTHKVEIFNITLMKFNNF